MGNSIHKKPEVKDITIDLHRRVNLSTDINIKCYYSFYIEGEKKEKYFYVKKSIVGIGGEDSNYLLGRVNVFNFENYFIGNESHYSFLFNARTISFYFNSRHSSFDFFFPECEYLCEEIIFNFSVCSARTCTVFINNSNCPINVNIKFRSTKKDCKYLIHATNLEKILVTCDADELTWSVTKHVETSL